MNLPRGKDFRPAWPLTSGHIQTMLSSSGIRRLLLPRAARTVQEGAEAVMVERLRAGRSVAVFPEGGTGHEGVLKVFHARIFQAALDAEAPLQPVALRFARDGKRIVDAGFREHESFLANFLRLLGSAPLDAEVHFLEPVPATPDARRRMAELSRERIAAALEDPAADQAAA